MMRYWIIRSIFNPIDKLGDLSTTYSGLFIERISILILLKIIHTRLMISVMGMRHSFVRDGGVGYLLTLSNVSRHEKDISEGIFDILLVLSTYCRFNEIGSKKDYLSLLFIHESSILHCIQEVTKLHNDNENIRFQANELLRVLKQANEKLVLNRFQEATRAFQLHLMPGVYQRAKSSDRTDPRLLDDSKHDIASLVNDMKNHFDNIEIQLQGFRLLTTYIDDELLFSTIDPFLTIDFNSVVISALKSKISQLRLIAMMLLLKLTTNPTFNTFFSENGGCCAFLALLRSYNGKKLQQLSLWVLSNLCSQGEII